jgi:hypothetical protein
MKNWRLAPIAVIPLLLAACGSAEVLTLSADETAIPLCTPGQTISVEGLDTAERPACAPLGSELVFPDGTRLAMGENEAAGSTSSSESPLSYGWYDVGVYGVVASRYDAHCEAVEVWGRAEAVDKLKAAFGDDLGNC